MKHKKKAKIIGRDNRRIRVTGTIKDPIDTKKLAKALLAVARQLREEQDKDNDLAA